MLPPYDYDNIMLRKVAQTGVLDLTPIFPMIVYKDQLGVPAQSPGVKQRMEEYRDESQINVFLFGRMFYTADIQSSGE